MARSVLAAALAAGVLAMGGFVARAGPATSPAIEAQIARLASGDWKDRKNATEQLVAIGDIALPRLREVAAHHDDGEVRARAAAAIARIEENRQLGATSITLELDGVSPARAVAELAGRAGVELPTAPPDLLSGKIGKPVSLRAKERPFWDVMQDLCRQADLEVTSITRQHREAGFGLTGGDGSWLDKPVVVSGPLLIRADHLMRVSTVRLKPPRDVFEQFSIAMTVFAEPKLKVLDFSDAPRLEVAVDDKGNSLIPPAEVDGVPANVDTFGNGRDRYATRCDVGATLHYPRKGAGGRIVRLRGAIPLLVQTRAATLEVPLAGSPRNVARNIEGLRVVVKGVDPGRCEITVHRDGRNDAEWYAVRVQLLAGEARLVDEKGRTVARNTNTPDADESPDGQRMEIRFRFTREGGDDGMKDRAGGEQRTAAPEASQFAWEFPLESRQLAIPFEYHDLPMPR